AYESNESGRFEIYVQAFPGPGEPNIESLLPVALKSDGVTTEKKSSTSRSMDGSWPLLFALARREISIPEFRFPSSIRHPTGKLIYSGSNTLFPLTANDS